MILCITTVTYLLFNLTDIIKAKSDQNVQYFISSTTVVLNYITVR